MQVEGPAAECHSLLLPEANPFFPQLLTDREGWEPGPATTELEAKLNKHKLNVVPQMGWNHFWGTSERRGLSCTPLLRLLSPGRFHEGQQVEARWGLSLRWQDRDFFHVVPKLAQMEAFWVEPLQSVNSSGWGQGSRWLPISASCLTEALATQSTMASSFFVI